MIQALAHSLNLRTTAVLVVASLFLTACGGGGGRNRSTYDDEGKDRIAVLSSTQTLAVDAGRANAPINIPAPYVNINWAQSGGNTRHTPYHLALDGRLQQVWRSRIGAGNANYERLVAGPVAADGKVFAMDVDGDVSAVSLESGALLWQADLDNNGERSNVGYGGGVSFRAGILYVTSGYGYVLALNANTGDEIWRFTGPIPFRGAPTVGTSHVYALTHDNRLLALDIDTGALDWDQVGIAENAGMLGAASPVYDGNTVVMALSSGELVAMNAINGRVLWQDSLNSSRRLTPLATLADIDGNPVIDGGKLYALSHAGSMVAIDMRSGERSWEADIAGVNMPWVAGDFAFLVTIDAQVVAISLVDGKIHWVTQLQRFLKQEKRRDLIKWNGPILAGDRLIVTSSHGFALTLSPYDGSVLSGQAIPAGTSTPALVVNKTLVILTDSGELVAYR